MQNSDLVEIITTFTEEERDRLPLYLESVRPSVRQDVKRLLNYVLQCISQGNGSDLSRKSAYNYLFPGQPWVDNKLEKLMSDGLSTVRRFAAQEVSNRQMNELQQAYFLQIFYNERGLFDKSRTVYKQIERAKSKPENWKAEDYYTVFLSEKEENYIQSVRNSGKGDVNLMNTLNALTEYFLVENLWLICQMLNQKQIAQVDLPPIENLSLFDLGDARLRWFFDKPLGQLFEKTISLLYNESQENVKHLRDFVSLLRSYEDKISKADAYLFEMSACNLGIRRVNKGNFAFLDVVFQIQKERVSSGRIYTEKGQISASEFLSILTNSLRLNELEWAKNFIELHKKRIIGIMPSLHYHAFALANYHYYVKEYNEARKILMTSEYEDVQYRISARILEIKALFELSIQENADYRVIEFLEDRIEAAILFFFRLKDVEPRKKRMGKRFADTMKRILHAHGSRDIKRLEKISTDVQEADFIAERQWLLGITANLIKSLAK